jgi:hypothetical protein
MFARLKNNIWEPSDGKSAKFDKVFIIESHFKNIPELNNTDTNVTDDKGKI